MDRVAMRHLNQNELDDQFFHHAVVEHALAVERNRHWEVIAKGEKATLTRLQVCEEEVKEKALEIERLGQELRRSTDANKSSAEAREEEMRLLKKEFERYMSEEAVRIEAAKVQGVQDYKISSTRFKDKECLSQPAIIVGYNLALTQVNAKYPDLKVLEDNSFDYDPDEAIQFDVRFEQFNTSGDLSEFWLEDGANAGEKADAPGQIVNAEV